MTGFTTMVNVSINYSPKAIEGPWERYKHFCINTISRLVCWCLPCCMSCSVESWWRSMYLSSSQRLSISSSSGLRDGATSVGLYINWALSVKYRRASNLKSHIPLVNSYYNTSSWHEQKELCNDSNYNNNNFQFSTNSFPYPVYKKISTRKPCSQHQVQKT